MRICLLSPPVGNGNLGDEATLAAVIEGIRRRRPGVQLCVFSANPDDTRRRHRVSAFPIVRGAGRTVDRTAARDGGQRRRSHLGGLIRAALARVPLVHGALRAVSAAGRGARGFLAEGRFLATSFGRVRGADCVILTGSGVLSDHFGGPLNFPYTIFVFTLLARTTRAPLILLSVGAGPLRSPLSRWLVKRCLRLASYVSARDLTSKRILDGLGTGVRIPVVPDLACGLAVGEARVHADARPVTVAINPFPQFDPRYWPVADGSRYRSYVTMLAAFASWLLEQGYRVVFFPTQIHADTLVMRDIQAALASTNPRGGTRLVFDLGIRDVHELLARIVETDLVVATRFHGILLSLLLRKPVLALANHHKMADLVTDLGLSEYLLDVHTATCADLTARFLLLVRDRDAVERRIAGRVSEYRAVVERQYDRLLSEVASGRPRGARVAR